MRISGAWKLAIFLFVVVVASFALGYYAVARFIL
jgi:hypothetical protein